MLGQEDHFPYLHLKRLSHQPVHVVQVQMEVIEGHHEHIPQPVAPLPPKGAAFPPFPHLQETIPDVEARRVRGAGDQQAHRPPISYGINTFMASL